MNATKSPFVFVSDSGRLTTPQNFLLKIASNIHAKMDLLASYEKEGRFPSYFGRNWDALLDCLRDMSWVSQKKIVIIHDDLPLANREDELRVYLEILETAVSDWQKTRQGSFAEPPKDMTYVEHELMVVFPAATKESVARVLATKQH